MPRGRRPPWATHGPHGHRRTLRGTLMRGAIAAVVVTGAIVAGVAFSGEPGGGFVEEVTRTARFVASSMARVEPSARPAVVEEASATLKMRLRWRSADGAVVEAGDGVCRRPVVVDVDGGGTLEACRPVAGGPPVRALLAIALVLVALSVVSSALARRIGRPLAALADTAWRIGRGDLSARPALGHRPPLEVAVVGEALADMAARIERELAGQRALLAGASHELRTPLGHLRLQVELARGRLSGDQAILDDIDAELVEIDALLEKLLASARLDFHTVDRRPLIAVDVCRRALERASLPKSLLAVGPGADAATVDGDVTLLTRAVGNLLENAVAHGGGVTAVTIDVVADDVRIVVSDDGAGVAAADRERVFEPFVHRSDRGKGSLGLGLHLVRRIAEAHGGRAYADESAHGARMCLTVPRAPATTMT